MSPVAKMERRRGVWKGGAGGEGEGEGDSEGISLRQTRLVSAGSPIVLIYEDICCI